MMCFITSFIWIQNIFDAFFCLYTYIVNVCPYTKILIVCQQDSGI